MAFSDDKVFDTSYSLDFSGSTTPTDSVISLLEDGSIYYRLELYEVPYFQDNDTNSRLFLFDFQDTYAATPGTGSWSFSGNNGSYTNGFYFAGVADDADYVNFISDISAVGNAATYYANYQYYNFKATDTLNLIDINGNGTVSDVGNTPADLGDDGGTWAFVNGDTVTGYTTELAGFVPGMDFDPAHNPDIYVSGSTLPGVYTPGTAYSTDPYFYAAIPLAPVTIAITEFDTSLGTWQYRLNGTGTWLNVDTALVNSTTNELALVLRGTDELRMVPFGNLSGTLSEAIKFRAADYDDMVSAGVIGSSDPYYIIDNNPGYFSSTTEVASLTVGGAATDNAPVFRVDYGEVLVNLDEDNGNRSTDEGRDVVVLEDGSVLVAGGAFRYDSSKYTYTETGGSPTPAITINATYTSGGGAISPDAVLSSTSITLTVDTGTLTGTSIQWYKAGAPISGATGTTYNLTSADAGSLFSVVVIHDSGFALSEYASISEEKTYESDYGVVKLKPDGSLDTSFGGFDGSSDGILLYDPDSHESAYAIDLQADGQIWVAGYSGHDGGDDDTFNDYNRFRLVEINPTGSSVTSHDYTPFYDGGPDFPYTFTASVSDVILDLEVLLGSDWVVAGGSSGWSEGSGDSDYAVRYYNPNGTLQTYTPWWFDTSVYDPSPITNPAPDNPVYNPYYYDNVYNPGDYYGYPGSYTQQGLSTLTEDASGRILGAGTLTRPNGDGYHPYTDYYVARLNSSGKLDTSFSNGGAVGGTDDGWFTTEFTGDPKDVDIPLSIISLPNGKVLVVGRTDEYVGDSILVSLQEGDDANFGLLGTADTNADGLNDRYEVTLTIDNNGDYATDGNTTSSGLTPLEAGQAWRYQWQYSPDGSSWSNLGGVTTNNYYAATLSDSNGFVRAQVLRVDAATPSTVFDTYNSQRYVVDFITDYDSKVSVLRANSNGDLDTTFDGDGKVLLDGGVGGDEFIPQKAVLDNDGNILVAGYSSGIETTSFVVGGTTYYFDLPTNHMQVIRLTPAGALDTTFGDGGKVVLPVSDTTDFAFGITVQPDDKIVITGSALTETDTDLAVVRLNADGTLDSGFGGSDALSGSEVTFVENGPPIVLYENLGIFDTEHDLLGNYSGARLVVVRSGGANSDDVFSGSGDLSFSGGNVTYDGTIVGTYAGGSTTGTLDITFNSSATPGDINGVLSSIAYSNSNDNPDSVSSPPADVVLDFTFYDEASTNSSSTSKSDSVSRTVHITPANDAPSSFNVTVSGTPVAENTVFTASVDVGLSDPDGLPALPAGFSYQWQSSPDGSTGWANIAGATGSTYTPNDPQVGKHLRVTVSYTDLGGTKESATSASAGPIANVNDAATGFTAVVAGDTEGDTLSLVIATPSDPDGLPALPAGYSYQWQISLTGTAGTWSDISGATSATLLADNDVSGRYVRAQVKYTDLGSGDAANTTEESTFSAGRFIEAVNDAPVGFTVGITGTVEENQVLTANAAVTSDGDGLPATPMTAGDFTYQWQVSSNGTSGWTNIAGGTSATFTPDDPQVGKFLRVITKYVDGGNTTEQTTSTATSQVTGVNDAPTGQPTITGTQVVGYTLGVSTAGISDADGLSGSFTYQWYREAGAVDTFIGSSSTYTLTPADVGEQVYVRVSYTDLQLPDALESVDSALSSVIGSSNTTGGVTISNDGSPAQGETVAAVSTISDPDGLGPFSYQWYRSADGNYDGSPTDTAIASATGPSYRLADADVGQYVFVVVSYTDGGGRSEVIPSSALGPIADTNEPGDVVISGSAVPLATLGFNLSDPDGVGTENSYLWERSSDGLNWSTVGTGSTLGLSAGDLGFQVRVTVNYDDLDPNLAQVVTSDPVLVVQGGEFGGVAYFWNSPHHTYLEGVLVTASASGYGPVSDTTDAIGNYGFGYMPDAGYTISASKDGASIGAAVTGGDATAILKMLVGKNPNVDGSEVSPYQFIAADIDGDGHISLADAIDALRMAVNAPNAPADEWLFVEESRTFWDGSSFLLNIDDSGLNPLINYNPASGLEPNLVGIVKGDVDGSWANQPAVSGLPGQPDSYFSALSVALGDVPLDLWGL